METFIVIGILMLIFISAFLTLIIVCRHKSLRNRTVSLYKKRIASKNDGIFRGGSAPLIAALELGEVYLHPQIEQVVEEWTADTTGLMMHCLEILKLCRNITDRVAEWLTVGRPLPAKTLNEIVHVARRISVRVDDMVRTMYPPLDSCLLEARSIALVLAVTQLVLVARTGIREEGKHPLRRRAAPPVDWTWADAALAQMDSHLLVLREAALSQEAVSCIQSATETFNSSCTS